MKELRADYRRRSRAEEGRALDLERSHAPQAHSFNTKITKTTKKLRDFVPFVPFVVLVFEEGASRWAGGLAGKPLIRPFGPPSPARGEGARLVAPFA